MIILGIDPGYGRCGFGVIKKEGQQTTLVEYGCIETKKDLEMGERLKQLRDELKSLIEKHKPEQAGVEELFFSKNTTTALAVAQARGVILLTLQDLGVKTQEFNPTQIKQAMTGYGNADKKQVQEMVKMTLKLAEIPKPDDAADAVAVAITTSTWKAF